MPSCTLSFEDQQGAPRDYVGREALLAARSADDQPVRVGLRVEGRRPPREEYAVLSGGKRVGRVTSGAMSPTLGYPIAMAYVEPECSDVGTELAVDVRGTETPAVVLDMPFYKRKKN